MKTIESIVPPLELCKRIPAGEFEDSALVWVYDDVVGFLCRTSGCEQIHKKEWQLEHNHPRKIAIRRKSGHAIYPAPTLEEILREIYKENDQISAVCVYHSDGLTINGKGFNDLRDSAATAALKRWMQIRKGERE